MSTSFLWLVFVSDEMAFPFRRRVSAAVLLTLASTLVRAQEVGSAPTATLRDVPSRVALMDDTSWEIESSDPPSPGSSNQDETMPPPAVPCLEPAPVLKWQDYQGPFQKVVGAFASKLELKSARPPHYKPGTVLCSLEVKDKFVLFVQDTFDPISFLTAAFSAGLDQSGNRDPTFGQGAVGYAKRFAADFTEQTTWRFFTDFAYPTIFAEDPRYYRLSKGSGKQRFLHAVEHTFVAQHDSGKPMFNFSKWLGTASAVAMSNVYHPGNERGFTPALRAGGYSLVAGMGFDVLREFWPEIARKVKMPFRDTRGTATTKPSH